MGPVRKIIIVLSLIVFCGAGYYIADYVIDNYLAQKNLSDVLDDKMRIGLVDLHKENKDLIGWVQIEGTKIDYPVMQTPEDNEYYLHRNFKKEYSEAGTLFMDAQSVVAEKPRGSEQKTPPGYKFKTYSSDDGTGVDYGSGGTWNWLVYGHHMKFGTMFHDLMKYESADFYKKHPKFNFNVLRKDPYTGELYEEAGTYAIVAAAYSQIYPEDSEYFKYYAYPGSTDEQSFNYFVQGIQAESIYNTGITPEYGTQLVILSTCAYHTENGRFYIVGARIK